MENPYQVTQPSYEYTPQAGEVEPGTHYPFRPANVLTPALRILYALLIPMIPAMAVVAFYLEDIGEQEPMSDQAMLIAVAGFGFALAVMMVFFTTVIVHCVWTNRMNKNARALGARDMEYTPGWAVGWFFVPIANLFKPFSATNEIYRASEPGPDGVGWKEEPTPGILSFWWACWIIGNILERVSDRLIDEEPIGLIVALVASGLTAASAAAAFFWVGQVHRRQLQTFAGSQSTSPEARPFENW